MAVTDVAWVIVTSHGAVPAQPAPLHPLNRDPGSGKAESLTTCPKLKLAEHVEPQSIPGGDVVTDPDPSPNVVTVSVATWANVAVTDTAASTDTTHDPTPAQPPPDQPANTQPTSD